ncbi:MAG: carboxymuconolactone decarboxylase family protein [Chloroflexi bacterium]|nr:carboxymuconolactone decarboxylase family protein [Chloroflexota bacterium]
MTTARTPVEEVAPHLAKLTGDLFGDLWERPILSKRERSLITVAAVIALSRPEHIRFHVRRALASGVTKQEIGEAITHLAFYAGWPAAYTAANIAKEVFDAG